MLFLLFGSFNEVSSQNWLFSTVLEAKLLVLSVINICAFSMAFQTKEFFKADTESSQLSWIRVL